MLDQAQERFLAPGILQVEHHALLVAVQADEVIGFAAGQGRAPGARDVAQAGRLDLDHLRAVIGEHGGAERPGERVAQVEYLDTFEWQFHFVSSDSAKWRIFAQVTLGIVPGNGIDHRWQSGLFAAAKADIDRQEE